MIVIDTNVALAILLEDGFSRTDLLENSTVIAPSFMKLEMLNVLRKYHFLRKVSIEDLDKIYIEFLKIIDEFVLDDKILNAAKEISYKLNHPIYDCLFLALALQYKSVFISFDQRLLKKAESIGIETLNLF